MNCPTCGRGWLPTNVRGGPPGTSENVGALEALGINWAEVMLGAALGAWLQIYLLRRVR